MSLFQNREYDMKTVLHALRIEDKFGTDCLPMGLQNLNGGEGCSFKEEAYYSAIPVEG